MALAMARFASARNAPASVSAHAVKPQTAAGSQSRTARRSRCQWTSSRQGPRTGEDAICMVMIRTLTRVRAASSPRIPNGVRPSMHKTPYRRSNPVLIAWDVNEVARTPGRPPP